MKKSWKKHRKYEAGPDLIGTGGMGTMLYSDEYLCSHGIGHDKGLHSCDGCCTTLTDVDFDKLEKQEEKEKK
jgi:hypothetical protein